MRPATPSRSRPARAFTLIESVISVLIVGLMLVAALNTVGAAKISRAKHAERITGPSLAQSLMGEVLSQGYEEPIDTPTFGRESSESGGERTDWDDIDDYDGWSATPPESKDGVAVAGLTDWGRAVSVNWVQPDAPDVVSATETGVKRIDVKVLYRGRTVTRLSGFRTNAWPDYSEDAEDSLSVLLVVDDAASPDAQDQARQALMEGWGHTVELIDDNEDQATFDEALSRNEVAYISATVQPGSLQQKLVPATIGVVNENPEMGENMGYGGTFGDNGWNNTSVVDNTHEITSHLDTGFQTILTSDQDLTGVTQNLAPGAQVYANAWISGANYKPSLFIIEPGGELETGDTAAGRRVQLPWGLAAFDVSALNDNGQQIMQKSIEWAADGP